MTAQAGHDILIEHDRTWIDPTFASSLTSVVLSRRGRRARRGGPISVEALRAGRITTLTPEQIAALDYAPVISRIPSEVEARLAENGLDLPKAHPYRRVLSLALLRTKVRG